MRLLEKRFPVTCPKCGAPLKISPSIAMDMGRNGGMAHHPRCGASMLTWLLPGEYEGETPEVPTGMGALLYEPEGAQP